jgi:uncharacterized protein (DUF934 family)
MPQLIKNDALADDRWTLVREIAPTSELPDGNVIVPLAFWLAADPSLRSRANVGVWLAPSDDPALLASNAKTLPLVAVDFPKFTDGRGYSIGRLLRERLGFAGELRAIGDIQRDQLYYLHQVGFDAFVVRDGKDALDALKSLRDFTDGYQLTNRRTPWFRRSDSDVPARSRGTIE